MRADLYIVANDDIADLRYFRMLAVLCRKAKAIGTDRRACMNDAAPADFAVFANRDRGVENRILPNLCVLPDIGMRIKRDIVADDGMIVDDSKRKNPDISTERHVTADNRLVTDPFGNGEFRRKEFEQLCKGSARIFNVNRRLWKISYALFEHDRRCIRCLCLLHMRFDSKDEVGCSRPFDIAETFDNDIAIRVFSKARAEKGGNLRKFLLHLKPSLLELCNRFVCHIRIAVKRRFLPIMIADDDIELLLL